MYDFPYLGLIFPYLGLRYDKEVDVLVLNE